VLRSYKLVPAVVPWTIQVRRGVDHHDDHVDDDDPGGGNTDDLGFGFLRPSVIGNISTSTTTSSRTSVSFVFSSLTTGISLLCSFLGQVSCGCGG
jgi:hypothetical protein